MPQSKRKTYPIPDPFPKDEPVHGVETVILRTGGNLMTVVAREVRKGVDGVIVRRGKNGVKAWIPLEKLARLEPLSAYYRSYTNPSDPQPKNEG